MSVVSRKRSTCRRSRRWTRVVSNAYVVWGRSGVEREKERDRQECNIKKAGTSGVPPPRARRRRSVVVVASRQVQVQVQVQEQAGTNKLQVTTQHHQRCEEKAESARVWDRCE
jgi:hypothetical protein